MTQQQHDVFLQTLERELIPALGCTEPIAIAYAAAKARQVLGEMPRGIRLRCSGNIIKNVRGVAVPNGCGALKPPPSWAWWAATPTGSWRCCRQ